MHSTIDVTQSERQLIGVGDGTISASALLNQLDREMTRESAGGFQPLGFEPLDRTLGGGLRPNDLLVIAGRPGVGKTVVSLQLARNLALSGGTVAYACYEHDSWTLLSRLLALEIGTLGVSPSSWYRPDGVRSLLDDVVRGTVSLTAVEADPLFRAARSRLSEYADRLHFIQGSPSHTGIDQLNEAISRLDSGPTTLFVDYLQKVASTSSKVSHLDHVASVAAGLKEIALQWSLSVVAIAAIGGNGLSKRRVHLPHLDGAVAVGYDADVVIMMNDKRQIVSSTNLLYTTEQADRFRQRVVFTIEKNRSGIAPVDLEFTKDFEHFRFDPSGSYVAEQLIEDGEHDDFRT